MNILEELNFKAVGWNGKDWLWQKTFFIENKLPYDYRLGKTKIIKYSEIDFTGDKRENVLY